MSILLFCFITVILYSSGSNGWNVLSVDKNVYFIFDLSLISLIFIVILAVEFLIRNVL